MSYTITLTDGNIFAIIPDGTLNNDSSMTLIGQNYTGGYGQFQNDNYIRLLETGSNSTAPTSPLIGQLWYNSVTNQVNVYTGLGFKPVCGAASSTTAPTVCSTGDLWFNTAGQSLNVYNGNTWITIGSGATGNGITTANIVDTNYVTHTVDEITLSGNIISIISQDGAFQPLDPIPGYANINPGINLPTSINSQTPIFTGTSTNSLALNGQNSSAFMSTLYNTSTVGKVSIVNNNGLSIGAGNATAFTITNTALNIQNNVSNANINMIANVAGVANTVVTIDGQDGSVIVFGNLQIDGYIVADVVVEGNLIVDNVIANSISANSIVANVGNFTTLNAANINATNITGTLDTAAQPNITSVGTLTSLALGTPLATQYGGTGLGASGSAGNVLASDGSIWYSTAAIGPGGIIQGLGFGGEIWHDVTGSRAFGPNYTNGYGYPIMVSATSNPANGGAYIIGYVNGLQVTLWRWQYNGAGAQGGAVFIVPPGATYSIQDGGGAGGVQNWAELY